MVYEFECVVCGNKTEIMQKVKDPNPDCSCGSGQMKKLISRSSFSLRGDCWGFDGYTKRSVKNK